MAVAPEMKRTARRLTFMRLTTPTTITAIIAKARSSGKPQPEDAAP